MDQEIQAKSAKKKGGAGELVAILIGTLAAVILLSLYWKTGVVYGALNRLDLIPRAEYFTELYFMNSASLPQSAAANGTITFSFGIRNDEGSTTTYPYSVYFEDASGEQTLFAKSSTTLSAGSSTIVTVSHVIDKVATGMVVVNLTNFDQSIDFLFQGLN